MCDEGDDFKVFVGFCFQTDEQMNKWTVICNCTRFTSVTENFVPRAHVMHHFIVLPLYRQHYPTLNISDCFHDFVTSKIFSLFQYVMYLKRWNNSYINNRETADRLLISLNGFYNCCQLVNKYLITQLQNGKQWYTNKPLLFLKMPDIRLRLGNVHFECYSTSVNFEI